MDYRAEMDRQLSLTLDALKPAPWNLSNDAWERKYREAEAHARVAEAFAAAVRATSNCTTS